jgi:hypothetical protein
MAIAGAVPAVVVVTFAGAAEAAHCGSPCFSDRRLKKNIRPI